MYEQPITTPKNYVHLFLARPLFNYMFYFVHQSITFEVVDELVLPIDKWSEYLESEYLAGFQPVVFNNKPYPIRI
jgi:hypothetical protein